LEGRGRGLVEVLSRHLPAGTEGNREDLTIADVLIEIRNDHLRNTGLDRYRYANLFGL
jgi:hypothetical protein